MPFVGEERGIGPGQGMGTLPGERPVVSAGDDRRSPSAARGRSRSRTRSPATTCCSACGSTSTSRASSTATTARPTSRRRSTWSRSGRRRALPTTPTRSAARLADEVGDADRRDWLGAQLVALETQAAGARRRGAAVRRARRALLRLDAGPARRARCSSAAAAELDALLPGDGPLADRLAAWDARFEVPVDRLPGVVDWLVARFRARAARAVRRSRRRGPARLARPRTSRGRPTTGTTAGCARASTSTPTSRSAPPTWSTSSPTRRSRATTSSTPGRRPTSSSGSGRLEASVLLINTPGVPDQRGPRGHRRTARRAARRRRPTSSSSCTSAPGSPIAADPAAARDAAERSVAMRPPRRRLAETRVNAALMRHADGASHEEVLAYLERRRPVRAGRRREAARVHRAPALADLRLRLPRGRGAAPAVARRGRAGGAAGPVRAAAARAADAGRDRRGAGGAS